MKHLFIQLPPGHPAATHVRRSDSAPGLLAEAPDDAVIHGPGEFVDPAGFSTPQPPIDLEAARAEALAAVDQDHDETLAAGVKVGGLTLAAAPADQAAFSNLLALLREAHELQPNATAKAAFLATPQVITDRDGTPRTMPSIPALRQLLVAYGAAVRDLWTARATRRAAIIAATNKEELAAALAGD